MAGVVQDSELLVSDSGGGAGTTVDQGSGGSDPWLIDGTVSVVGDVTVAEPVTVDGAVTVSGTVTTSSKVSLTASSPTAVSVGVATTVVLATNSSRKSVRLVNTSSARISIAFGANAVLDSGITLYPQGSFNMDEYDFTTAAINGIASVAASNLAIQEYT